MKNLISEAFSCLVILQINWKGTTKPKLYEKKKIKKNNGIGGWWQFYFEVITCLYRWCHIYIVLLINLIFTKKNLILNFYHFIYILMYSAYFLYPLAFTVLLVVFLLGHFKKRILWEKIAKFTFYPIVIFRKYFFFLYVN